MVRYDEVFSSSNYCKTGKSVKFCCRENFTIACQLRTILIRKMFLKKCRSFYVLLIEMTVIVLRLIKEMRSSYWILSLTYLPWQIVNFCLANFSKFVHDQEFKTKHASNWWSFHSVECKNHFLIHKFSLMRSWVNSKQ